MRIEIDQSGRIEYTSHKTVLAFSNVKQIGSENKKKIYEKPKKSN